MPSIDKKRVQQKISNAVALYQMTYPGEYKTVVAQIKMNRSNQQFDTGALKGDHVIERAIHEIPEKLQAMFLRNFDQEESEYFTSKEGARWFAKAHPEFSLAQNI